MSHVNLVDPASSKQHVRPTLDAIKGELGIVPNMFKPAANSPAVLASK